MNHRDFFNEVADKWDQMCNHDEAKLRYITKMAGISQGDCILDVGTGTGVMIPYIHEMIGDEGEITAIDLAEKMLEVAKQKYPFSNVHFVLGDIYDAYLPKNHFDVIMCYSVFPHFQDKPKVISRMAGLLKPSGRLVIAHSQSRKAINEIHAKSSDSVNNDDLPEADVIEQFMKEAGLEPFLTVDSEEMFIVISKK